MSGKRYKTYSSGESLTELLVAALIISLAMIMLFSGAKVGSDIMRNSRDKYQEYNEEANRYEEEQATVVTNHSLPKPPVKGFVIIPEKLPIY